MRLTSPSPDMTMALLALSAFFTNFTEHVAEVAVAHIGPQRPVQRAAFLAMEQTRPLVADRRHAIHVQPQHPARVQLRLRNPHPRHHALVQVGMFAAAFAAIAAAHCARGAGDLGGEALGRGTHRRRIALRILHCP